MLFKGRIEKLVMTTEGTDVKSFNFTMTLLVSFAKLQTQMQNYRKISVFKVLCVTDHRPSGKYLRWIRNI